jgi:hypothetical protein
VDIEQPQPASMDDDIPDPEVTEPDEWPDFEVAQAEHDARRVAAFFGALAEEKSISLKRAERLTIEWMAYTFEERD